MDADNGGSSQDYNSVVKRNVDLSIEGLVIYIPIYSIVHFRLYCIVTSMERLPQLPVIRIIIINKILNPRHCAEKSHNGCTANFSELYFSA